MTRVSIWSETSDVENPGSINVSCIVLASWRLAAKAALRNCKVTLTPPDLYSMQAQACPMELTAHELKQSWEVLKWSKITQNQVTSRSQGLG